MRERQGEAGEQSREESGRAKRRGERGEKRLVSFSVDSRIND